MSEVTGEKPVEKIKDAAQQAAKAETTSPPKRRYRTILFQLALLMVTGSFATLTFLVKTTPLFPADIQITRTIQTINSPTFEAAMRLISWPGFAPQAYILSVLI